MKILPDSKAHKEGGNCLQKVCAPGNTISPSQLSGDCLLITGKIREDKIITGGQTKSLVASQGGRTARAGR
jgi:hypothetical protein